MKPYITDIDGVIYRPDAFWRFSPTRDGKVNGYFNSPVDGQDWTTFNKNELDFSADPTFIPALPGYFLLQSVVDENDNFESFARDPIIAWQVEGASKDFTPVGLELGVMNDLPVVRPDGIVQTFDLRYDSEGDYAEEIRSHERRAKLAANQA